ncbi:S-adenosyl-L-methionine-dependent methyltransferase [Trematosphaeria pertusa]|uniref:S-adenosyl-L-methionine-dependent methyltransferase n=1 Tax=Trematosphaeria pertusa TaxID=390896 RepID=A0A6A6I866_9PLEO|nr:S-adenosyl-L-methionine-dependent methyltransferase [Trematosphaeria pertusa]KAF2246152.1 S-adenosyl-L-methionine-dependent methyltransferase [Trematosphaeria pertusa]
MSITTRPYVNERHWLGSMRLNFQHFFMGRIVGHLLHPNIKLDKSDLHIIDLGAGTGIWAQELATELPSASIYAVDISDEQFPPEKWRTPNVSFAAFDCLKPFPEEYLGRFDVVNVRAWLTIVNDDNKDPVLENFLTLLKPGGYIQWFEPLPLTAHTVARDNGQPTPGCDRLAKQWHKPAAHSSYDWVINLSRTFTEHNLEVIVDETLSTPDRYQPIATQSWLAGLQEYRYQEQGSQLEEYQKQLIQEAKAGAFVDVKYTLLVGRKCNKRKG